MRILGNVAYKGSAYQGWQKQINANSIQQEIETVLSKVFNEPIKIYGSGRTDSGVHAYGQTFHFDITKCDLDLERLKYSINSLLPEDILINNFTFVNDDFHARISAKSKCYEYIIEKCSKDCFNSDILDVEKEDFDLNKFQEILTYFNGEHNFMNFTSKEEDEQNFIRNIYSIGVENNVNLIHVTLVGNGFMRYMIRYIIGTALAYSRNKITKDEIITLLNPVSSQRNIVSYKASPNGLYLKEVQY